MATNSVILVSIKVKNLGLEKRVFARCTDNDWQTFADLPAQYVGGVDNLGYEYDRFCVAVRRPATTPSGMISAERTVAEPMDLRRMPVAAATVEFAICYQVNGQTYWDNNEFANYRIEWFDGPYGTLTETVPPSVAASSGMFS
jgi:protein phosphatase 1 regulatory subunit 3A/B/C/D/E